MADPQVVSHWNTLIDGLQFSSKEFYGQVEEAIAKRQIPNCAISRVSISEGGLFSSSREYLRVVRKEFKYDICAAPFGSGFFVSSWLLHELGGFVVFLASLPFIGFIFTRLIKPLTYYQIDTGMMFQTSVHAAVLEAIDAITKAKGLRAIGEAERKPIMREFFAK